MITIFFKRWVDWSNIIIAYNLNCIRIFYTNFFEFSINSCPFWMICCLCSIFWKIIPFWYFIQKTLLTILLIILDSIINLSNTFDNNRILSFKFVLSYRFCLLIDQCKIDPLSYSSIFRRFESMSANRFSKWLFCSMIQYSTLRTIKR